MRYPYAPQPPTEFDTQTKTDYEMKRSEFFGRSNYIDGLYTNSTYTNIAHFWYLKQMLNAKEWRFSTDHDSTIISAINPIRRRISILERPLVTSRGDGKSYIYSNFNPRYAQYTITILRTYYNFCMPYKAFGELATPAQRIGITDKIFDWEDIIYFR